MLGVQILFNLSSMINPPIPWGPRRLLCPVKANAFNENSLKSILRTPALCALSNMK